MKFQVIGSGSKGNLTYIESNNTRLLIDAGISIKEIKNRTNIDITNIDGIFITHEHIDHVKYIENIARLSNAVIYVNEKSFNKMVLKYFKDLNDINEAYFYNTFIKFVNKFNYIGLEEQVILNFLFEEIKEENKNLEEVNNGEKKYIIK